MSFHIYSNQSCKDKRLKWISNHYSYSRRENASVCSRSTHVHTLLEIMLWLLPYLLQCDLPVAHSCVRLSFTVCISTETLPSRLCVNECTLYIIYHCVWKHVSHHKWYQQFSQWELHDYWMQLRLRVSWCGRSCLLPV